MKEERLVQLHPKILMRNDQKKFLGVVLVVLLLEDVGVYVGVDVGADEIGRVKLWLVMISKPVKLPLAIPMIRIFRIRHLMVRKRATLFV